MPTRRALPRSAWPRVRLVCVGSGSDGMDQPVVAAEVVRLIGKPASEVSVLSVKSSRGIVCNKLLNKVNSQNVPAHPAPPPPAAAARHPSYIGTPTYDLPAPYDKQTRQLSALGCRCSHLKLTEGGLPPADAAERFDAADAVVVSGGNPLFAMARWDGLGISALFAKAMNEGKVMCGGSCGLVCWFDAAHSDSADPTSYKDAMHGGGPNHESGLADADADANAADAEAPAAAPAWPYLRVDCLGLLPGLVCPHYDRVQSNGVLRATDFEAMMLRHPKEHAIAVDHWAALVVEAGRYSVLAVPGKTGSQAADGRFVDNGSGVPGAYLKSVSAETGAVVSTPMPPEGELADILRPAAEIVPDPRLPEFRAANPASL